MIQSSQMKAFDLEHEPADDARGLRQRAVRPGLPVGPATGRDGQSPASKSSLNGWDTHFDNFPRTKELAGQVDQPLGYLITDLKQRGMLDSTLVMWMGEFGRTPKINPRAGRDHYPKAFNVVLAGGGVRGGQVIGKTDAGGGEVDRSSGGRARPVPDFLPQPEDQSHGSRTSPPTAGRSKSSTAATPVERAVRLSRSRSPPAGSRG